MDWDAIGAVGEITGAVAVVVSVVYLSIQIRRQTDQSRLAATREVNAQRDSLLDLIIESSEVADLYLKAVQDYESMPHAERIRASLMLQKSMRTLEQVYLHTNKKHVDPAYFESLEQTYFEAMAFPGIHQWWKGSKQFFEPEFRSRVDALIVEAKKTNIELPPLDP